MKKNRNRILAIILTLVLACSALPLTAAAAGIEGTAINWTYDASTKTLSFTGRGDLPDYMINEPSTIPDEIPWYAEAKNAETVVLGEGITGIGACCFALMPELTTAVLPSTLTKIGQSAFTYDMKLRNVTLPAGLTEIGQGAFMFNDLTAVEIPAGMEELSYNFCYCPSLTTVTLHEGLRSVQECFAITPVQSLTIPSTVETFATQLINLKTLVNNSASVAVYPCVTSTSDPEKADLLPKYYWMMNTLEINYLLTGEEPTEEDEYAYFDAFRLWINETYGENLQTIEDTGAFFEAHAEMRNLPRPDVQIFCLSDSAEHTALDQSGLPHYLIDRDNAQCDAAPRGKLGENVTWELDTATGTLTIAGSGSMIYSAQNAGYHFYDAQITSVVFAPEGDGITSIAADTFRGLVNVTSLTVPEGVTEIGSDFILNSGITTLTLPGTLNSNLNEYAFRLGSTPLQTITMSDENGSHFTYNGALYRHGYNGAELVKLLPAAAGQPLAENVTYICAYAVENVPGMTSFTVPGTVNGIASRAFQNLPDLQTIDFARGTGYYLTADSGMCGDNVSIAAYTADPDDNRVSVADGVLYNKEMTSLLAIPGQKTVLDLPETVTDISNSYNVRNVRLDRVTVRNPAFRFDQGYESSLASFLTKNTVIVCHKGSAAEGYALRFSLPLEFLDAEGVTVANVGFDYTEANLQIPQYEEFIFSNFGVKAVVSYSDGTATEITEGIRYSYSYYENGSTWPSTANYSYTFEEAGEYSFTVSYGDRTDTFSATVAPGDYTYEFDTSALIDSFGVYEYFNPSETNLKMYKVYTDETREEVENFIWGAKVDFLNVTAGDTEWSEYTGTRVFSEPCDVRMRVQYRGQTTEVLLHFTEENVRFTLDDSEAVYEVDRFGVYDLNASGLKLFVTRDGVTEEISHRANIYQVNENGYYYGNPINTEEVGEKQAMLVAEYSYEDDVRGYVDFNIRIPFTVNVVQGDVTAIGLDVSQAPTRLIPNTSYSAQDLGVRLVKTLINGDVAYENSDQITLKIDYHNGSTSYGSTVWSGSKGNTVTITAIYGDMEKSFNAAVMQAGEFTIDDSEAKTVFRQYLDPITFAAFNLHVFRTENGVTEEMTEPDDFSMGWNDDPNVPGMHTAYISYYNRAEGVSEEVGEFTYEVVATEAELNLNNTPTQLSQYDYFPFRAKFVTHENGETTELNLYYYCYGAGNDYSYNRMSTDTAGTVTVTPYIYNNGTYIYLYDYAFNVEILPAEPTFRLDASDVATEVGLYVPYSCDNWGMKCYVSVNGGEETEIDAYFKCYYADGTLFNYNDLNTNEVGVYTLQPYVYYKGNEMNVGEPFTVTVVEGNRTLVLDNYVFPETIEQYRDFRISFKVTVYENGEIVEQYDGYECDGQNADGEIFYGVPTSIPGVYTIRPYTHMSNAKIYGETFTVTVTAVEKTALDPTADVLVEQVDDSLAVFSFTAPADGDYVFTAQIDEPTSETHVFRITVYNAAEQYVTYTVRTSPAYYSTTLAEGETITLTVREPYAADFTYRFLVGHTHVPGTMVREVSPTCAATGVKAHSDCTICKCHLDADGNVLEDLTIDMIPHTYGEWIDEVAADCTKTGVKGHYHCDVCGKDFDADKNEIADLTLAKGGHAYGEWISEIPADCTKTGVKGHYHCGVCGKDFDADKNEIADLTLAKGDHAYGEWISEIANTCTEAGVKGHYHCGVCGKDFDADKNEIADLTLAAKNHNYRETARTESTCVRKGSVTYTCANDPAHTYTEELPLSENHTDNNGDGKCDLCSKDLGTAPAPSGGNEGDCPFCHQNHTGFFGKIVGFFHRIAYFFAHLFGRM